MKGKLVKEYEDFYLISDKEIEKGDEYVKLNNRPRTLLLGTTISHVTKVSKLSLKNCEAIELGYDLDELAKEYWVDEYYNSHGSVLEMNDFKEGFNKAMELNKDKLFTVEDMENCWDEAHQAGRYEEKGIAEKGWKNIKDFFKIPPTTNRN
jgi:hypothetical protein